MLHVIPNRLSQETLDIAGISIAVAIHSLDPLECRHEEESYSIDISLRWSESHSTKVRFFETSLREGNLYHNLFRL